MNYYAIQSSADGYIQWTGEAIDESQAIEKFAASVGSDVGRGPGEIDPRYYPVTRLGADQYARLKECDGTDMDAVRYLEASQQ